MSFGLEFAATVGKANPCHNPSGPAGGQFCSTEQGSAQLVAGLVSEGRALDKAIEAKPKDLSSRRYHEDVKRMEELDKEIAHAEKKNDVLWAAIQEEQKKDSPNQAVLNKLGDDGDEVLTRLSSLHAERSALAGSLATKHHYHEALARELQAIAPTTGRMRDADLLRNDASMSARGFVDGLIGDAYAKGHHPVVRETTNPRSYANGRDVFMHPNADAGTGVHELGHWLENVRPDVYQAAGSFLNHRWNEASRTPAPVNTALLRPLRDLTGSKFYEASEVAFKDKFTDAYAGKFYADSRGRIAATEIISMGLESLYRRPLSFKKTDPEYYYFMLGVLKQVNSGPTTLTRSAEKHLTPAWSR